MLTYICTHTYQHTHRHTHTYIFLCVHLFSICVYMRVTAVHSPFLYFSFLYLFCTKTIEYTIVHILKTPIS